MTEAKVDQVTGRAAVLRGDDIDTDRIIPARFMKAVTFDSVGEHLFEVPVRLEQAIAHEDGLLAPPDDVSIETPVVVCLVLLAAGGRGKNEREA